MRRIGLAALLALFAAVAWWVIGFLPWVTAGFTWPTTNAAPVGSSSAGLGGVRLPLPLVAIDLPFMIASAVIGGVLASLAPIAFTRLARWFAVIWVWLAVGATVALTAWFTYHRIRAHAGTEFAGDRRVLQGLAIVLLVATLVGVVAGSISVVRHGFTSVAAALVAGSLGVWLGGFLVPGTHSDSTLHNLQTVTNVSVAVVLALGLAVSVHRNPWAVILWPVAAAIVWCAGPAYTASVYLAGQLRPSAGLPGSLPDLVGGSRSVFWDALKATHPPLWPLAAGFGVGLLALLVTLVRRHRAAGRPVEEPVPSPAEAEATAQVRREDPSSHAFWLGDEKHDDDTADDAPDDVADETPADVADEAPAEQTAQLPAQPPVQPPAQPPARPSADESAEDSPGR